MRELCTRGAVKALAEAARRRAAAAIFMVIKRCKIDSWTSKVSLLRWAGAGEAKLCGRWSESHHFAKK